MTNLTKEMSFSTNISSNKTYLVTNINDLELIDFQIEMVNRNVDGTFLNIEKKEENSKNQLCFETTSLISLDSYFKKNTISRKNFFQVLKNLCTPLVKGEEQYLSLNNYVLDLNKIYIDKETLKVKYIYIPIEQNYNMNADEKFKDMVKDIVQDYVNIEDTYSNNYIEKILSFLKKEKINIQEFNDFFLENIYEDIDNIEKENIQSAIQENINSYNQPKEIQSNLSNSIDINSNPVEVNNNPNEMNNNQVETNSKQIQVVNNLESNENQLSEKTEFKEIYKTENIIVSAVTCFITVVLVVLTFVMLNNSYIIEKIAVAIILALVDFLIFMVFLDKEDKVKVPIGINAYTSRNNVNSNNINNNIQNNNEGSKELTGNNNVAMENVVVEINNSQMVELLDEEFDENFEDETMLLTISQPYLLSNDLGEPKKIYIDKERFRIGRLSPQVDFAILNKVVGKIHAEIIFQNGMYYIIDLNSKNGTFINRKRLDSNVAYVLNDKDEIMIANIKYILRLY